MSLFTYIFRPSSIVRIMRSGRLFRENNEYVQNFDGELLESGYLLDQEAAVWITLSWNVGT